MIEENIPPYSIFHLITLLLIDDNAKISTYEDQLQFKKLHKP
jgi:hypothetical protein